MNSKVALIAGSIAVVVVAFFAGSYVYKDQQRKELAFLANKNFKLFVPDHAVRMGAENPKAFLIEYLDPECESCRMMAPYVKEIMKEFGDRVQLVIRYAPFHGNSEFAVKILEAARMQGQYWQTLDLLFRTQPYWGDHHNPQPEKLWDYLPTIGLDIEKLKEDMKSPKIDEIIKKDVADLQVLGVRQTPTFYVNGKPLQKFGPHFLRELVEAELK